MADVNANPQQEYGIALGSTLFTLIEPWQGHALAYNRWYERDHFYAGVMIGPFAFAGRRWVATRSLKTLRYPADSPVTSGPNVGDGLHVGSFLSTYWVLAGDENRAEYRQWAVDQVNRLHAQGRMFPQRDHVHTEHCLLQWSVERDPDGVPPFMALDHPFAGLVAVFGERTDDVSEQDLDAWYRHEHLPGALSGSPVAMALCFRGEPMQATAPADVARVPPQDRARRFLHLYFLDSHPAEAWEDHFAGHGDTLAASGLGRVLLAAPFIPTIPGTDSYVEEI